MSFISVYLQLAVVSCSCRSPALRALTPRALHPLPLYPRRVGVTNVVHAVPPRRTTFAFSHSVSVVPAGPSSPSSCSSETSYLLSFALAPRHSSSHPPRTASSPVPRILEQPESLPSASLLRLPRSLDPSAFYYQPHYLQGNPAPATCSATLPRLPQAGRSCYTIFYCVFTTGHNYY